MIRDKSIVYGGLILYKAVAELKAEAARTYLSFLWWVLEPLMTMAIFYLVFGLFLQSGRKDFVPFLLIGLIFWNGFSNTVLHGASALLDNGPLMLQTYIPKWVFPLIVVVMDGIKFALVFVLLLLYLWLYGFRPTWSYLALIPLLGIWMTWTVAATLLAAALVPFLPDLRLLIASLLQLMFFASGVFFAADAIPESYRAWFYANPMAALITAFRAVLMEGTWPMWSNLWPVVLESGGLLVVAVLMLWRWDRLYPKLIGG